MKDISGKYKFLEHTADVKFQASGKDLNEVFINSALAMGSVLMEPENVKLKISKKIKVIGESLENLMYNFLEEFLFLMDTESFILGSIKELKIENKNNKYILTSKIIGDKAKNYDFSGDIKSITYHEMFIKKEQNGYKAQVVVDV